MGVGVKAQRKSAPWEKACSEARAAVRLQSPCSCRCFGSKTSMFSIHCKVIKLVRQNWMAWWFKSEDKRKHKAWGGGDSPEIPCFHVCSPLKIKGKKNIKSLSHSVHANSPAIVWKVAVAAWKCLTLHHVAAGRLSREIFKGLLSER